MKQTLFIVLVVVVLSSGCISNNSESAPSERDRSVLESATSSIESSDLKISYDIRQLENRTTAVDYWIESGTVRKVESSNNLTEYRPPESSNSSISITCEDTCTWHERSRTATGPILRPEGNAEKGSTRSVEGGRCTEYSVSDVSEVENYFGGVQFQATDPSIDYCINEDTGIIHETIITSNSEFLDHVLESSLINSEKIDPSEIEAPEAISRTENCNSNVVSVVTTEQAREVELEILDASTDNQDMDSLNELDRLGSVTVETEKRWKPKETEIDVEDEKYVVTPLVDGEIYQSGASACIF
mgnify:CR=1 FL=1